MEETEIEDWIRKVGTMSLEELVDTMVGEANRRGAPDNVTVALLTVEDQVSS
jgi:serine/threonine protein phosphatase PrpC